MIKIKNRGKKILTTFAILFILLISATYSAQTVQQNNNNIEKEIKENDNSFSLSHTVFAEECTATWCQYCPSASYWLYQTYQLDYDFYFVTLVDDKNSHASSRINELGVTAYPNVVFDGGYTKVEGGQSGTGNYENAIQQCGDRDVADVDLDITASWMGGGQISVTAEITNNEDSTYTGHLHVYVTEISSRWDDYDGDPYHFAMLDDYAINQDVSVSSGSTDYITETWTGPSDITQSNIKVIGSVFAQSTMYTDETAAADPEDPNNDPPSTPSEPSGPSAGNVGIEYTFSTSSTEPNEDTIKYGWDWNGDDNVDEWTDLHPSGETAEITHHWDNVGTYDIKVKAKDQFGDESSFSPIKEVQITIGQ
ncbi:MAG: PKD domain-containing protein, partial [Candidatus Thermoplasmatota archaeon]